MPTLYRQGDPRYPFLWERGPQPAARWHAADDAPATYLADTPDGAWAEFLRHEAITDPADLAGIARRLWAVEVPDDVVGGAGQPRLPEPDLLGGLESHPACRAEASRQRASGAQALRAPSAALTRGAARGQYVGGGLREADPRDGRVVVLFGGDWPQLRGWAAVDVGAPTQRVLGLVRHLAE